MKGWQLAQGCCSRRLAREGGAHPAGGLKHLALVLQVPDDSLTCAFAPATRDSHPLRSLSAGTLKCPGATSNKYFSLTRSATQSLTQRPADVTLSPTFPVSSCAGARAPGAAGGRHELVDAVLLGQVRQHLLRRRGEPPRGAAAPAPPAPRQPQGV